MYALKDTVYSSKVHACIHGWNCHVASLDGHLVSFSGFLKFYYTNYLVSSLECTPCLLYLYQCLQGAPQHPIQIYISLWNRYFIPTSHTNLWSPVPCKGRHSSIYKQHGGYVDIQKKGHRSYATRRVTMSEVEFVSGVGLARALSRSMLEYTEYIYPSRKRFHLILLFDI